MVSKLPFLALHLSVQLVAFITDISRHFVVYLSLQLFDEVEQFNYSHFSMVELRNRELNDLPKVVQEVCGRELLCPGAFLQDVVKTQLQRWDVLINNCCCSRMEFYLGCLSFRPVEFVVGECKLIILGKKEKNTKKKK